MPTPTDTIPTIIDVRLERIEARQFGTWTDPAHWRVTPVWSDVDRPDSYSWGINRRDVALRLVAAVRAGAVMTNPTVAVDVNGRTYVQSDCKVMAKYANADLRRLGF